MLVLKYNYQSPHVAGSFLVIDPKQVTEVSNIKDNEIRINFVNGTWKYIKETDLSAQLMMTLLDNALRSNTLIYKKVETVLKYAGGGG